MTQDHGLTPFEKAKGFFGLFSRLKHRHSSFLTLFQQKIINDSFPILTQNHGLTRLDNHEYRQPKIELFIEGLFDLFSSLQHRQSSFLALSKKV